eukprot:3746159-Pleurochrysis_carterae.AAC.5
MQSAEWPQLLSSLYEQQYRTLKTYNRRRQTAALLWLDLSCEHMPQLFPAPESQHSIRAASVCHSESLGTSAKSAPRQRAKASLLFIHIAFHSAFHQLTGTNVEIGCESGRGGRIASR